jgi:BlaI family penicillinase repressor
MRAVWEDFPASVRDVLERVEGETGWAYTTVKTILERLVEKGALGMRKRANTGLFQPLLSREQARQSAVQDLLDKAFDGTFGSLVRHFVTTEKLSRREREKLSRILSELEEPCERRP